MGFRAVIPQTDLKFFNLTYSTTLFGFTNTENSRRSQKNKMNIVVS